VRCVEASGALNSLLFAAAKQLLSLSRSLPLYLGPLRWLSTDVYKCVCVFWGLSLSQNLVGFNVAFN